MSGNHYRADGSTRLAVVRYRGDGTPDTAFSGDGRVSTNIGACAFHEGGVVVQPDGKLVVGGQFGRGSGLDMLVVRFQADGTLDSAFGGGSGGVRITTPDVQDMGGVAIQPGGRIVIAGGWWSGDDADFAVGRLLADGNLDPAFGGGGMVRTELGSARELPSDVVVQASGRIVAGGRSATRDGDFALAGYRPSGALDPGFGAGGRAITDLGGFDWAEAIAVGPGDELALAGWSNPFGPLALARYLPDGTLDPAFGAVTTWPGASAEGVAVQPDGRIVVGGWADGPTFAAARFLAGSAPPTTPPPPPQAPGPAPASPALPDTEVTVRFVGRKRVRLSRRRVVKLRLACPASEASPPCTGTLALKTRRRVRFRGRRRKPILARTRFKIGAEKTEPVKLRLAKRTARLVRGRRAARRAWAIARVRDAAGNRSVRRTTVKLRPWRPTRRSRGKRLPAQATLLEQHAGVRAPTAASSARRRAARRCAAWPPSRRRPSPGGTRGPPAPRCRRR